MSVAVQSVAFTTAAALPQRAPSVPAISDNDQLTDLKPRLSFPRRPLPVIPSVCLSSTQMSTAPPTRTPRSSLATTVRLPTLATICADTGVLSCLLGFISGADVHSLSGTSGAMRRLFFDATVKDVVLSHFVPGYSIALRAKDRRMWEDSIRMTYADLGLVMASLDTPLHRYPMHALSMLSSDLPTSEQMHTTKRLQMLARAHSRVVLLLQNMVHSTAHPVPSELNEALWKTNGSAQASLRELTFPAPLSYFDPDAPKPNNQAGKSSPPSVDGHKALLSCASSPKTSTTNSRKRHSRKSRSVSAVAGPSSYLPGRDRSTSRLYIFGGSTQRPPPQPSTEPTSLRYYSGNWRRSYYMPPSSEAGELKPPKRRFVSSRYSSNSSLGSSPSPSSGRQTATPNSSSLHDLYAATKRNRAPILRVFVPCSSFSEAVITVCEDQLIDEGLWAHLSVGDVVCNFGYVPPVEEADNNGPEKDHRCWLVFSGDQLKVYHPTEAPPISGALSLPSPFYYTHVLPSLANPHFRLALPPLPAQYALTRLTTTLASPHAPSGHVRVKTFMWIATIDARPGPVMNAGWAGEWVLQGEGTPEGRLALQNALQGGQESECEYEVVIEKSGGGKLWLRMLTPAQQVRSLDISKADLRTDPTD